MCSDHFSPWSERQGESGFAWSWLGAALQATSLSLGCVNAPGQRYHPAIIAQAAATLAEMFPGRFWVALGSGEASNEHITGEPWPDKATRNARLRECVDVMRALFAGEVVDHDGLVTVDRARLWTLPAEPPKLIGAAVSAETAGWVGRMGRRARHHQPAARAARARARRVPRGRRRGQAGLPPGPPLVGADEQQALDIAYDQWRTNLFQPPIPWDLHTVEAFDEAARFVRPEDVRAGVLVSADLGGSTSRWLQELADARVRRDLPAPRRPGARAVHRRLRGARAPGAAMRSKATSDLWWKNAVVYCLDVETFLDSDGDGCGDLPGLTERIDYLAGIGVSCLWLMPFYPSPRKDDGYDITDFYGVDPRLGTHGDFVELVRTARDRGIRVIADLVMNHTSDQHPWFQAGALDPDSPYRDFYVWVDEKPPEKPGDVVFPDKESSNWAYDGKAGQYYLHRFYSHQPDLNIANPEVRDEIAQVVGFWLEQGLSGFRVDAVPFMLEPMGMPGGAIVDPHELLRDLRRFLGRRNGEAILLGEVNLPPEDQRTFFGDEDGDELHMLFSFTVNQAMYLALARESAAPLEQALAALPAIPPGLPVGELRAQPRRADARQALGRRARGGVRRLRPREGAAAVRPRPAPPAADDARRRRAADADGLQPRCSRCPARRCCSTARRSAWARTSRSRAG